MSKPAQSIRVYSFYLFLFGAGMMFIPNVLLPIFGFQETNEVWIRMLGLFTFTTGIYYFQSSRFEQTEFYKATIMGRIFFFLATCMITLVLKQSIMLAAIGSIDLMGALWTWKSFSNNKN